MKLLFPIIIANLVCSVQVLYLDYQNANILESELTNFYFQTYKNENEQ